MSLGIVDFIIVIFLILGAIVGFKNGAIKEGTKFIGFFVIVIVSFLLKDKLMVVLYENLPFFDFFGLIKGLESVNVLLYQLISFLIIFLALLFVLRVLIVITGLIEWILKMTVFLSIPSKLLGIVVGMIEYYVYVFIALYILSIPIFNLKIINESKLGNNILEKTPVLSGMVDNTVDVYTRVWDIIKTQQKEEGLTDAKVNQLVLATLLDNKLITVDSAKTLVEANKIIIEDKTILDNYKEEENFFDQIDGCKIIDCN